MFARSATPAARSEDAAKADYAACSGCSLCLLACPVWRGTHDLRYTPHGRAKALQHGVPVADLAPSIESCTLCGSCEPACPENIGLVDMVLGLRRQLPALAPIPAPATGLAASYAGRGVLLAGAPVSHQRAAEFLRCILATDGGSDIALALEAGADIPAARLEAFLAPLRAAKSIIATDGLLARALTGWLPRLHVTSLGFALSQRAEVRGSLRAGDLYVIEPRAFHLDHARRVQHYDNLRHDTGCAMNLDLQRFAIPATARNLRQRLGLEAPDDSAQARWILLGRKVQRIVAESWDDIAAFRQVCDLPVVYIAELLEDTAMKTKTHA